MRQQIIDMLNRQFVTDEEVLALGPEAVPTLIELFGEVLHDNMGIKRQAIIHMLGLLDGDQAVDFLKSLYQQLADQDETLKMELLSALARTDHPAALEMILPLLETGDKRSRKNIITGLRGSRRAQVLAAIRKSEQSDPDESLREYATRIAAEIETRLHED